MRNGINVWINVLGEKIKSDTRPQDGEWYPAYPPSRVRGDKYEYYNGTSEWIKAANAAMKSAAQYNFQIKNTR